uniref:Uncharacterized protein n=1 Tax=Globisporangium ultimum (strain ATCC 200006 / CBS 805.95 / DAOM BR144) TaxID=431595 RepID=K3W4Y2_GLOUD
MMRWHFRVVFIRLHKLFPRFSVVLHCAVVSQVSAPVLLTSWKTASRRAMEPSVMRSSTFAICSSLNDK